MEEFQENAIRELGAFTESAFQKAFKQWKKRLEGWTASRRGYFDGTELKMWSNKHLRLYSKSYIFLPSLRMSYFHVVICTCILFSELSLFKYLSVSSIPLIVLAVLFFVIIVDNVTLGSGSVIHLKSKV